MQCEVSYVFECHLDRMVRAVSRSVHCECDNITCAMSLDAWVDRGLETLVGFVNTGRHTATLPNLYRARNECTITASA